MPAGTPQPIVERLNAELNKALKDPEVLKKLAAQGAEPLGSTPEEYGASSTMNPADPRCLA